ncbi:MAG: hypothetical protein E7351_01505 [Clostridiales bacterium]|nr:hypothetical protein [Clostridiales bacterium]
MFKYRYNYKYLNLKFKSLNIVIELAKDNTWGNTSYSAKTNLMFKDEYDDWGHAAGVGRNEQDALNMCIDEIEHYTGHQIDMSLITEINLAKKIVFEYKKQTIVLNIEQIDNNFSILTPNGRKNIITDNIIEYISNNLKEFINDSVDNYSEELFKMYNFSKPFDAMTKKYNNSENCNLK